jgi:hypothetical protein
MALGRYVLEHGALPPGDIFSHTAAGREWISSGWGASVLMHWLFREFGPAGLTGMVFGVLAAAFLLLYATALKRAGGGGAAALIILVAILASYMRFNPRPDVWSIFFTAILMLLLLSADSAGGLPSLRRLWLLPPLFVAWANLHAGFLAGLVVVAIYLADRLFAWARTRSRSHLLAAIPCTLCFVAWMLNPYGLRIAALAAKIRAIPGVTLQIFEWMPLVSAPGFNLPPATYVGICLLLGFGLWEFAGNRDRFRGWHWAAAAFFVLFAVWQRRQIGLLAVALPALLTPGMKSLEDRLSRFRPVVAALGLAATLGICAMQTTGKLEMGEGPPGAGMNARMLPCAPADFLEQNRPPGRLFNSYGMGGYLLYFLGPETKVFIDGRLDIYDPATWQDYLAAEENTLSIDAVCARYGVGTFAIDIRESHGDPVHLANRLAARDDWGLVFFDDDTAVFVKRTPGATRYLTAHEFRHANPFRLNQFLAAIDNPETREEAAGEIKRALQISLGSANAYALGAWAASRTGESQATDRALEEAFARNSNCPLALQLLEKRR